jgi:hypothetical protein
MIRSIALALVALATPPISSETVFVENRGLVELGPFACTDTPRSSMIQRVCYDKSQAYALVNVRGKYYQFCELPPVTFDAFVTAGSMGQFYNQEIKGSGSHRCGFQK